MTCTVRPWRAVRAQNREVATLTSKAQVPEFGSSAGRECGSPFLDQLMAIIVVLPIVLFIAWALFESAGKRAARRVAGGLLGLAGFLSFVLAGALARFDANSYCNSAAAKLLRGSVEQLERGRTDAVLRAWQEASKRIDGGGYERRADFEGVVKDALRAMER